MNRTASTRTRTRFFVSRWIRRWIKRILEEDTSMLPAVNWQRTMKSCISCNVTLRKETKYCPQCGVSQHQQERVRQTEWLKKVQLQPLHPPQEDTLTYRLATIRLPGERPMDTYNRLVGKKIV